MILQLEQIQKSFWQGGQKIEVLQNLSLAVAEGEQISIVGPSGGGKSTLLSIISGLDLPDSGSVQVAGKALSQLSEDARTHWRATQYGIVFQQFHLLAHMTALENVQLPLEILNDDQNIQERARQALQTVGLNHRLQHFPHQLSGGENQRVAIARALVTRPKILLADEPSGNLDQHTGEQVMNLLFDVVQEHQTTLVLVTHNLELAERCQKVYRLSEGKLH